MPTDRFDTYAAGRCDPASYSEPVDIGSGDFVPTYVPTGIVIGTAGTVVGRLAKDTADRTFKLAAGLYPLRFVVIRDTSTASDMVVVTG